MEQNNQPTGYAIPLAIVIAGALVAWSIYAGGSSPQNSADKNPVKQNIELASVSNSDHILGNPDAPIKLVVYSDTECPFCKTFHYTTKQVANTYPDQVAIVFRHFPIAQLHSRAIKEAEALECAAELGGNQIFWSYLDQIFAKTNSNDSLDPAELPKIAQALGLNTKEFDSCLSGGKHNASIQKSIEEAVKAGARGTPYSVLITEDDTKVVINGAEPFESVKLKIESLIK